MFYELIGTILNDNTAFCHMFVLCNGPSLCLSTEHSLFHVSARIRAKLWHQGANVVINTHTLRLIRLAV